MVPETAALSGVVVALVVIGVYVWWRWRRERLRQRVYRRRIETLCSLPAGFNLSEPLATRAGAEADARLDGRKHYFDLLGHVVVKHDNVRRRFRPALDSQILGVWRKGQTLKWMGVSEDEDWWLVWSPENGWQDWGWTHHAYLTPN